MWRRLIPGSIACLFIVAVIALLFLPASHAFAASAITAASPTPDATTVLNAANNAVSQAQNTVNFVGVFATIVGVVLGFLALLAAGVSIAGINTYRKIFSVAADLRTSMTEIRAEAENTRQALVYLGLGDQLLGQKNTEEALENYKRASRLLPSDAQVQYLVGRVYSSVGNYDDAIAILEKTHPLDLLDQAKVQKELGLAYRRRGSANKQAKDFDRAIEVLKKAIDLNPYDSDAHAILGGLYRRQDEYAHAFSSYEEARRINPYSSYALGNLASLSWYLGKQQDALLYFGLVEKSAAERIKKGQPEVFWDYYDLALAQLAQGKVTDAKQIYALAIKETPGEVQFEGVLDNLHLLQKAPQAMPGLDDVVKMIEDARGKV